MKAAVAFGSVASLEVGGVKLRNVLLLAVQKDFEGKTFLKPRSDLLQLHSVTEPRKENIILIV
jgi:hypothetical protein